MTKNNLGNKAQKGSALIMALILIAVLSVVAASMISMANSEAWSTANYKMMSQARDGAEAAAYRAIHFLVSNPQPGGFTYAPPTALTAFDQANGTTTSPVTISGTNVGLTTDQYVTLPSYSLTYPTSGSGIQANVQSNFASNAKGTLVAGNTRINYGAYAELLAIKTITGFGGNTSLERWKVTGEARIVGAGSTTANANEGATVVVSTIVDRPAVPAPSFAAYATSTTCDNSNPPLNLSGGSVTGSYNSSTSGCSAATYATNCAPLSSGGDIGTNGYANLGNSATVNGTVYEVQNGGAGGGNCTTALTGGGTVNNGTAPDVNYQSQAPQFPTPLPPTPTPTAGNDTIQSNANCAATTGCVSGGAVPAGQYKLTPTCTPAVNQCGSGTVYRDLNLKGATFHLCAGTYNVNSIAMTSNATIILHPTAASDPLNICGGNVGATTINVQGAGFGVNQTVIDFTGGTLTNPSLSASNFRVLYGGTATVKVRGGGASAALIYSPNAAVQLSGGGTFYGALVGNTVTTSGGTSISYDRSLQNILQSPGNPMIQAFTWKSF